MSHTAVVPVAVTVSVAAVAPIAPAAPAGLPSAPRPATALGVRAASRDRTLRPRRYPTWSPPRPAGE
ncbi:hypothetical protein ACH4C6_08370 [Streptomyces sp. NPDC017943]|uniref:hypothetical protein n=1 Tax=Streptomyces sp. NPDC017943 TaxID=3365019 RepID=UPI00378F9FA2